MFKQLFLLVVSVLFFQVAIAQIDSSLTKNRKHYVSVNGTFFVKQFLSFTDATNFSISPYFIEYRFMPKKHGFRVNFGGNFNNRKDKLDSSQVSINNTTELDFRIGYLYQKNINKRWDFYLGADIINSIGNSLRRNNTTSDIVSIKSSSTTLGFGPSLGIQFNINNRIGLFTETAMYYQFTGGKNTNTFFNFPEFNTETSFNNNRVSFILPTSLFFFVRF